MKKKYIVSLLAAAAFASQAYAAEMCLWNGGGDCWPLSASDRNNCKTNAWIFDGGEQGEGTMCRGGTFTGEGKTQTPPSAPLPSRGCCLWETETVCWDIYTEAEVTDCSGGDNQYWSGACPDKEGTCPGGTPIKPSSSSGGGGGGGSGTHCCWEDNEYNDYSGYCGPVAQTGTGEGTAAYCTANSGVLVNGCGGCNASNKVDSENCGSFCKWPDGCVAINTDPDGLYGDPITSCSQATSNCESNSDPRRLFNSMSECENYSGPAPIRTLSMSATSNIVKAIHNGVNVQLTGKTKIQVYDLKGNLARSLELAQGSYNVELSNMPRGTYIVRVIGSSWKQTVTVPVK